MTQNMSRKTISFIKMHGLGNDFILIDDLSKSSSHLSPVTPEVARKICHRRFGVGADQVLWLKAPRGSTARSMPHARMEIFNADGSAAEMCGNGIRAVALYLKGRGSKPGVGEHKGEYKIETLAGLIRVLVLENDLVRVDMGPPRLGGGFEKPEAAGETLTVLGQKLAFYEVSMGNPHAVIFVEDVERYPVDQFGSAIERNPRFPERTNVEFVQVMSPEKLRIRVWERGAGLTLACGTGACAAAVTALATAKVKGKVTVQLPGGDLAIEWAGSGASVLMEGAADEVFRGEFLV